MDWVKRNKPDKSLVGMSPYGSMAEKSESLYMTLKYLTGENSPARKVITSTQNEDGFTAWWNLNAHYTQALAGRQAAVMNQFTATHSTPGRTPAETRTKMLEIDNAVKRWTEAMGEDIPEQMLRTAYVGIMDRLTRSHLSTTSITSFLLLLA